MAKHKMCKLCAQKIPNMKTSDQGKKCRLIQAECYKECNAQLQKAKQVQAKVNLLIQSRGKYRKNMGTSVFYEAKNKHFKGM